MMTAVTSCQMTVKRIWVYFTRENPKTTGNAVSLGHGS